ncbi:2-dehydropantoate 2-reductase [Piedraia hortae CBS 480.64]|uniref:2-dehydropantoate 2-reductase n=1 Tax=Piedraia hortae CBS 480.64 TaxID=1314780 RepID=A0A6A7C1Z8_9PEZI|nr:2-dehydropantoate 2-reductase [Piedraia hortae CBS 480.64]
MHTANGDSREAQQRIHLVGIGSIGKLVAHSLRSSKNPPPVSLIFHRENLLKAWNGKVTICRDGIETSATGFDVELNSQSHEAIHNLIVTSKAHLTASALLPIRHRILPTTSICLLQNGLGVVEEIKRKVFLDERTRPIFIQGIITHGVNVPFTIAQKDTFYAVHAAQGTVSLGLLKANHQKPNHLIKVLERTGALQAADIDPSELFKQQLEKLVVNAIINPLTSLVDDCNVCICSSPMLRDTIQLVIAEIGSVIRALPELSAKAHKQRFSDEHLFNLVMSVADKTRTNISSMLADIRAGRQTEIEYINGYIINRAKTLGISCPTNTAIMHTVLAKSIAAHQRRVANDR